MLHNRFYEIALFKFTKTLTHFENELAKQVVYISTSHSNY
jgi:hypothetical protein